jgi:hypothetical protein
LYLLHFREERQNLLQAGSKTEVSWNKTKSNSDKSVLQLIFFQVFVKQFVIHQVITS